MVLETKEYMYMVVVSAMEWGIWCDDKEFFV